MRENRATRTKSDQPTPDVPTTTSIARSRREQLIEEIAAMTNEVGPRDLTVLELELLATLLTPAHRRVLAGRLPTVGARPVLRLVRGEETR